MSLSTGSSISQEVLLAGAALKHTFHGLSPGTEYTISVTAATDAGLGRETAITAATVAMPQSLEAAVSVPSMYSMYGLVCAMQYNCAILYCTACMGLTLTTKHAYILPLLYYSCRLCVWSTDNSCTCIGTLPLCKVRIST